MLDSGHTFANYSCFGATACCSGYVINLDASERMCCLTELSNLSTCVLGWRRLLLLRQCCTNFCIVMYRSSNKKATLGYVGIFFCGCADNVSFRCFPNCRQSIGCRAKPNKGHTNVIEDAVEQPGYEEKGIAPFNIGLVRIYNPSESHKSEGYVEYSCGHHRPC